MPIFRCKTKNRFQGRIWRPGDVVEIPEGEYVPRHFIAEEVSAEEVIEKEQKVAKEALSIKEEIEAIRAELDALEVPYDKRWGLTTLKGELLTARKERGL